MERKTANSLAELGRLCAYGLPVCLWVTCVYMDHLCAYGAPVCIWITCVYMDHLSACGAPVCIWGGGGVLKGNSHCISDEVEFVVE